MAYGRMFCGFFSDLITYYRNEVKRGNKLKYKT